MPETWVVQENDPDVVDLKTVADTYNVIEVRDVHDGGNPEVDRIALQATNTGDNDDDRALMVEGMAEIVANVFEQAPGSIGLLVSNASRNSLGRALKVEAPFDGEDPATIAMEVTNLSEHQTARALKVDGRTEIEAISENDLSTTALQVINRSNHNTARALWIEGRTYLLASMAGDPALEIINAHVGVDSRALVVDGLNEMNYTGGDNEDSPCLKVARSDGGFANPVALRAEGKSEIVAIATGNPESTGLSVTNASTHAGARALEVSGVSEFDGRILINDLDAEAIALETVNSDVNAASRAFKATGHSEMVANAVGASNALQLINTSAHGDARALLVTSGKSEFEADVIMSSDLAVDGAISANDVDVAANVDIEGVLRVGPAAGGGLIDSGGTAVTPQTLSIGTENITDDVVIGHGGHDLVVNSDLLDLDGALQVGDALAAGSIDAGGNPNAQNLQIGTNATTDDVVIGHAGHDLVVNSDNIDLVGALQVGPADNPGLIDSGGSVVTPRHLKIGTSTSTDDVQIGNGAGFVDMFQIARMNDNGLVMDDAATVAAGTGLIFNDAGH